MSKALQVMMVAMLAVAGVVAPACADAADQVLYWMVDDPDVECGVYGTMKASQMEESHGSKVDSARVAVFLTENADDYAARTISAGDVQYLNLYYDNGGGSWVVDPSASPAIDTVGIADGKSESYVRASIGTTLGGADYSLYSFAIELGAWGGTDESEWMLAAISESQTYAELTGFISSELTVPTQGIWEAGGYVAAPEPSSGILMLLGASLLALRRRRAGAAGAAGVEATGEGA